MHKCLTEKQIRNAKERAGGPCVEEVDRNPLHLPTEKNNFSIRVYLAIVYFYTPSMISAYGLQHTQTHTWAYPARGGRNNSESSNILLTYYRLKTVFVATCNYWLLWQFLHIWALCQVRVCWRTMISGYFLILCSVQPKPGRMIQYVLPTH